jgi:hypothetical protein
VGQVVQRIYNGEDLTLIARLDEGSHPFRGDQKSLDLITLPVNYLPRLISSRMKVLAHEGQQSTILHLLAGSMGPEHIAVDRSRDCLAEMGWEGIHKRHQA